MFYLFILIRKEIECNKNSKKIIKKPLEATMKQMFKYTLWIMFVLIFNLGCTIASRDTVDLEYQDSKILETLIQGPYKSIEASGDFNQASHSVWNFDTTNMEATTYIVADTAELEKATYTFDVTRDDSMQEGIIRLYGSGPLNDQYMGLAALTNAHGSFLKINIQNDEANAIENAAKKPFWEYVTDPTIFRANMKYGGQTIVSLDSEGFWNVENYEYLIPVTDDTSGPIPQYYFEHFIVTTDPDTRVTTATEQPRIYLTSTTLIPANTEIYRAKINDVDRFIGMEFFSDREISTEIKFINAATFEEAKEALTSPTSTLTFGWDLQENALINNKVIRLLSEYKMVLAEAVDGNSTALVDLTNTDYFWDKTDQLEFNADDMTLKVITTRHLTDPDKYFGVTNFLSYELKMTKYSSDTAGVFQIQGVGKYDGHWGILSADPDLDKNPDTDIIYADFKTVKPTDADASNAAITLLQETVDTPTYKYQDQDSARRPYRLAETMEEVGDTWVKLTEDATGSMSYQPDKTEIFTFLDIDKRTLQYALVSGGSTVNSFYKVEVVVDNNNTNGVFLLHGYTGPDFMTADSTRPMHGRFIAIDRGSELYKTQAKYAVGRTLEETKSALANVLLFNLHEKNALPSNYRVISAMEKHLTWIALTYNDPATDLPADPGVVPPGLMPGTDIPVHVRNSTYELDFKTDTELTVSVSAITPNESNPGEEGIVTGPTTYELIVAQEFSPTRAVFELAAIRGSGGPNWDTQFMAVETGTGVNGNKAYIAFGVDKDTAVTALDKIDRAFYNYHAKNSAPKEASVIKTIKDISFIESDTEGAPKLPNGIFTPYNTKYYHFTHSPLTVTISITNAAGLLSSHVYGLEAVEDNGDFRGIVQLKSEGLPLHDEYLRIDVQRDGGVGPFNGRETIRIIANDELAELATVGTGAGIVPAIVTLNAFKTEERTHINKAVRVQDRTAIDELLAINEHWAQVDSIDKMDDYKNGLEVLFDATAGVNEVTIKSIVNNQLTTDTYTYEMMENVTTAPFNAVVRLIGTEGAHRNQYMALQSTTPTTPPNDGVTAPDGVAFGFGISYTAAKGQLLDAYIPYVAPYADGTETTKAFTSYLPYASGGYGTDTFVKTVGGAFITADTEIWAFGATDHTVSITHKAEGIKAYNVYMISAAAPTGAFNRASAVLYLRSTTGDTTAPYHKKYIHIKNHEMIGTVDTGMIATKSTFTAWIHENRLTAIDGSAGAVQLEMKDFNYANIAAGVLTRAKAHPWVRLTDADSQFNKATGETWTFEDTQVTVKTLAVTTVYSLAVKADISKYRGAFILSKTGGIYDNTVLVIGIGGEPTEAGVAPPDYPVGDSFDIGSMRLSTKNIDASGSEDNAQAAAIAEMNTMKEWNFRKDASALLPFNPIANAATISGTEGWAELKWDGTKNKYVYDNMETERWIFKSLSFNNVDGSTVHDLLISATETAPNEPANKFGIKLITTTTGGTTATFRIFRNNDPANKTNQYVVLEYGVGLNTKLMRVGTGTSLNDAEKMFGDLVTEGHYNWSTYDRAVANDTLITGAAKLGKWSLMRFNGNLNDSTETGSATTSDNTGYVTGADRPTFAPKSVLEYTFDIERGVLTINNIIDGKSTPSSYGMTVVENPESTKAIYLLSGFGPHGDQYLYLEFAEVPTAPEHITDLNKTRAKASVAPSLQAVKNLNAAVVNKWNLFASESIKVDDAVFTEAAKRQGFIAATTTGAHVELGYKTDINAPINVYDTTLTKSYTIIPTIGTYSGVEYTNNRTIIISNVSPESTRDDVYTYEMHASITDGGQKRAIAYLNGSGPDGGKYITIRLPDAGVHESSAFISVTDQGTADNSILAATIAPDPDNAGSDGNKAFRYRVKSGVESTSTVLTTLGKDGLVTLDGDNIYLDSDTTEWTFNAANLTASVIVRDGTGSIVANYKTILVKNDRETATAPFKGIIYLRGVTDGAALNGKYVAIIKTAAGGISQKTGTYTEAYNYLNTTPAPNLTPKTAVHFPKLEPVIASLVGLDATAWNSLTDGTFVQDSGTTIKLTFLADRNVTVQKGTGALVNLRFKPVYDESVGDAVITKAMIQIVPKAGSTVPTEFSGKTIALDIITPESPDAIRLVALNGTDITAAGFIDNLTAARDTTLTDPNYIPEDIFIKTRASLDFWFGVSRDTWRMVNGSDELIGNTEGNTIANIGAWMAAYEGTPTGDRTSKYAPWTFDLDDTSKINVSRAGNRIGSSAVHGLEPVNEYLIRMISHEGPNTGIFRMYRGTPGVKDNPYYNTEISNQYYAFKVGTETDHFRARLYSANSIADARTLLNDTEKEPFNNLMARELWVDVDVRALARMNLDKTVEMVTGNQQGPDWGQWVKNGAVIGGEHEYITFDHELLTMSVIQTKIDGINTDSTKTYGLKLMQNQENTAYYSTTGFGAYGGRILVIQGHTVPNESKIFFTESADGHTYNKATAGFTALGENANYKERRTILPSALSIAAAQTIGAVVSVDKDAPYNVAEVKVLNLRDNTNWQFNVGSNLARTALVTITKDGVATTVNYSLGMLSDETGLTTDTETKGAFKMTSETTTDLLHNKYVAMHLTITEPKSIRMEFFDTPEAAVAAYKEEVPALARDTAHYPLTTFATTYTVATMADTKGTLVTLDQDNIYLNHETREFRFDANANSVNIITKGLGITPGVEQSDNYFLNPVKGLISEADGKLRALYYLKGSKISSPLNNHFVAFEVQSTTAGNQYGKFIFNDTALITDTDLENMTQINVAVKESVFIDDSSLLAFEEAGAREGVGTLNTSGSLWEYQPNATEEIYLDAKQRLILYVNKGGVQYNGGNQETNYYRIQIEPKETDTTITGRTDVKRISWVMIENTRDNLQFQEKTGDRYKTVATGTAAAGKSPLDNAGGNPGDLGSVVAASRVNWNWAFGIPQEGTGIFLGFTSPERGTMAGAKGNRDVTIDPKIVSLSILKNIPNVSKSLDDQLTVTGDWYIPVDEKRKALSDVTAKNFAFRTPVPTTGALNVYDFQVSLRNTGAPTTATGAAARYLTKVIKDGGTSDGVVLPYGAPYATFATILSNQYVALRYGTVENENKVKLAIGTTEAEAEKNLNALTFWNYVPKSVLEARPTIITNLASTTTTLHNDIIWVYTANAGIPEYVSGNTRDLTFSEDGKLSIKNTADGKTDIESYDTLMVDEIIGTDAKTGIFQLVGYGASDRKFMAVKITVGTPSDGFSGVTARYGIGNTTALAKTALGEDGGRANMYRLPDTTKSAGRVFGRLNGRTIVEATFKDPTYYYDPKDVHEYTFSLNSKGLPQVIITSRTKDGTKTFSYEMELSTPAGDLDPVDKGYYALNGPGGDDNGAIMGIFERTVNEVDYFKIQVGNRTYGKLHNGGAGITAGTVIPNTVTGQKANWDKIYALNIKEDQVVKPTTVLTKLQSLGAIASMATATVIEGVANAPIGNYDEKNTETYNFSVGAHTLQVIKASGSSKSYYNYNVSIVEGDTTGKIGVLYAVGSDANSITGTSPYHEKFIKVNLLDDDRFIFAKDTTVALANTKNSALAGRQDKYKYSYWTHEKLDKVDVDQSIYANLAIIGADRSIIPYTINSIESTPAAAVNYGGFAFLADTRFHRTLTGGEGSPLGVSRVKLFPTGTAGITPITTESQGKYFDANDTYILTMSNPATKEITITKKGTSGTTPNNTAIKFYMKVLASTDINKSVVQFIKQGPQRETHKELYDLFENKIVALDLGKGLNSEGIKLGIVNPPANITPTTMNQAISDARTDRNNRTYHTMIHQSQAMEQYRVLKNSAAENNISISMNAQGIEAVVKDNNIVTGTSGNGGGNNTSRQVVFNFAPEQGADNYLGPRNNYYNVELAYRRGTFGSNAPVNNRASKSVFRVHILQNIALTTIFKLHSPFYKTADNGDRPFSTKGTGEYKWATEKYHAIQSGTKANVFRMKHAVADTQIEVLNKIQTQPFFNYANVIIGVVNRHAFTSLKYRNHPGSSDSLVSFQQASRDADNKRLTNKAGAPGMAVVNRWTFDVLGSELAKDAIITVMLTRHDTATSAAFKTEQYILNPIAHKTDDLQRVIYTLSGGIGDNSYDGHIVVFNRKPGGTGIGEMYIHKPLVSTAKYGSEVLNLLNDGGNDDNILPTGRV